MQAHYYVRIPKTASSSIDAALPKPFGHRTALSWIEKVGREKWDSAFTFTFVRHPVDRFLSAYYYSSIFGERDDPNSFLKNLEDFYVKKDNFLLLQPQHEWICDKEGNVLVDFIGRFENLQNDWEEVCDAIGWANELPHAKASLRKNIPLTQESKKILREFYAKDFELLGY